MKKEGDLGSSFTRRGFLSGLAASTALPLIGEAATARPDYTGPNVIVVRFGGGVRRRETIDPDHTYAPYLCKELAKQGTLFPNMSIEKLDGINTSHGEGTLNILTGIYDRYADVEEGFLKARFEAKVPTLFEYLRKSFAVADHETLIVNGEDRTDEEFYSFSNHHLFGAQFKSEVISLFRFKAFLLEKQLASGELVGKDLAEKQKKLGEMKKLDYRTGGKFSGHPKLDRFWEDWREFYGDNGFVNPRGDRLLTALTLRAMKLLRPRLVMLNYNDPDYVHWGNMSHYTRGVSIIDDGLRQLVEATQADDFYRDNTVFVVVPDCGRDTNPLISVPCQHHFNTKTSYEIWSFLMGPGIAKGGVVDREVQQTDVAATVAQIMGMEAPHVDGRVLEEAIS